MCVPADYELHYEWRFFPGNVRKPILHFSRLESRWDIGFMTMGLAALIEHRYVIDRRTDRRTHSHIIYPAIAYNIASCIIIVLMMTIARVITVCTVVQDCCIVRVVPISIGNGTFGGPAAQKPLNRSTWNLAWMITFWIPLDTPNGMSVG